MRQDRLKNRIETVATNATDEEIVGFDGEKPPVAIRSREKRESAFKFGALNCYDGDELACVCLDMSSAGARIRLQCASILPKRLRVSIPALGCSRDAEVRWQTGAESGLMFVS